MDENFPQRGKRIRSRGRYRVDSDAGLVTFSARLVGSFREKFELNKFPFDCQWLTVRFSSTLDYVRFAGEWPFGARTPSARPDYIEMFGFILEEWQCAPVVCMQVRAPVSCVAAAVRVRVQGPVRDSSLSIRVCRAGRRAPSTRRPAAVTRSST